jgi:hypothetical protein
MKFIKSISTVMFVIGLLGFGTNLYAHESGSGDSTDGFMVTRHITGSWDQVDQENQGLSLDVIEQLDGSRRSVVYWFTYGADRKATWYLGIGDLIDDRIEFVLYESTDIGFMQDAIPDSNSVQSIGSMTIVFEDCDNGAVTFETSHEEVGSGSFNITRLTNVMNTHCSGGISDDMHADAMFGQQLIDLLPARDGITDSGHARYEDYPGHMEFELEVEGLPDGDYHLYVGTRDEGDFTVHEGRGDMKFASPAETGKMMMAFDPRGKKIEIHDTDGVVLSSFDNTFEEYEYGPHGNGYNGNNDHYYDCQYGHGMGGMGGMGGMSGMGGMHNCVDQGEYIEIEVEFVNTGVLSAASGEAEWRMNTDRVEFSVEIEDVPVGSYPLRVGGVEVGNIEVFEMMHYRGTYGHIVFRDPETYGREYLDFEPRGQTIEVLQGDNTILKVEFPSE